MTKHTLNQDITDESPISHQSLGKRVREVRTSRGVSQERMGKYLGVSFQQVQKYETGANRISAIRLCQMALLLEVSVGDLLERPMEITLTKSATQISGIYSRLAEHKQRILLGVAKAMEEQP